MCTDNPPVPPNSYWRWPWWDVQNTSLLTTTLLGAASYLKAKAYYDPGLVIGYGLGPTLSEQETASGRRNVVGVAAQKPGEIDAVYHTLRNAANPHSHNRTNVTELRSSFHP